MRLAVIPARGGSKRIPRKNVRTFCGKPMIAWSIETARMSGCFDRIVVSTDDREIAEVARSFGAEVPFLRPDELADDHTGTIPVIAHAIEWHREHDLMPDQVCCIYATAPFMTASDLIVALETLVRENSEYVFPVASYEFPIQRAIRLNVDGRAEMFCPGQFATRSQDLEEAFHDAGQFYWGRASAWMDGKPIFSAIATPLILPRHRVLDIDTPDDWSRAEFMFEALRRQ
jgi:N-acylneuraminate cytidylyltransferase|tara:strand:+ start:5413 stop:6102 length:690 start_codon:yes stop_codon:yes gene_type:complete